ncbi:MAG: MASE3 domain-containing protein [Desulfuromonadales bacterium]
MSEKTLQRISPRYVWLYVLTSVAGVVALFLARSYNYLLFHSLVELVTIAFAFTIFLLAWNTRDTIENDYIKVVCIGIAACAGIDLIHTLAYKGMNVFSGYDANLPTQLWIAARFLQALTLVAAPFTIKRALRLDSIIAVFILITTLLLAAVFSGHFPDCYLEGSGLTPFKIGSEYLIVVMIIASIALLYRVRNYFSVTTYRTLVASSVLTVCAEGAFTSYIGVYDFANMLGHLFKLTSFYLVYRAIFVVGIRDPFSILYNELKQKENLLVAVNSTIENKVREQTRDIQVILEGTSDVIAMINTEYRYTLFNSAFHDEFMMIFGKDVKPGDSMLLALEALPEDLDNARAYWDRALGGEDYTVTRQFGDPNLVRNWYELHFSPVRDSDGTVTGAVHVVRNVTERKQMEENLREAKNAAVAANFSKSAFLANMSHEIRTPMNGMLGMTQLLEMTELTQEQLEYVASLKQCGKNLLSLINDILDLSKIEAGKITIEYAEFSLKQCINDVVLMQRSVAFEKGVALDIDMQGGLPALFSGDQLRVKQILLNLLANAVKFTAAGSVTVSARLLEQHETSVLVRIAVRDTGIGIAAEAVDHIFKPFTQEDGSTSRKFGGTGLGLTISRRLAELMGGTISVESTQGVGSCFTVTLPFLVGRETASIQVAPAPAPIGWDGPPLRILFVEDDQVNITFGASLLKKLGFDVVVVENGRECLTALEQGAFDLVLMDIQMPVMNGEEAVRKIRAEEQGTTDHQPVVALTAYSMRGDRERFLNEGFDGYISKPLITRELVGEIKRVMEVVHG